MVGRKRLRLDFNKKYGRLTLLTCLELKHTTWKCRCDCGNEVKVWASQLASGGTKSCGCLKKDRDILWGKKDKNRQTHGMHGTPEYGAWTGMKQRCYNPKNKYYKDYGGRNIKVCKRWLNSFENFYTDMGPRPDNQHSLDRINNDGNYKPNNCRWADWFVQANNRRK